MRATAQAAEQTYPFASGITPRTIGQGSSDGMASGAAATPASDHGKPGDAARLEAIEASETD